MPGVMINGRPTGPRFAFTSGTAVEIETPRGGPASMDLGVECRAFQRLFLLPAAGRVLPLECGRINTVSLPPGRAVVFPDVTPEEIEARYEKAREAGLTVAPLAAGGAIPAIRAGTGPCRVLVVTRLQAVETSGTFAVDGMLAHLAAEGVPEDCSFAFVIEPHAAQVAAGPGVPDLLFSPDGTAPAEQALRRAVDAFRPRLYINLHDWTGRREDGLYTVDDNLWAPWFLRQAEASTRYNERWDVVQKQNVPRIAPYLNRYSVGEEMARYCYIAHGAMAVYAEFPWDGRSVDDMRVLGGVFLRDILETRAAFAGVPARLGGAFRVWHAGKPAAAVIRALGAAEKAIRALPDEEARAAGLRVAGLVRSRHAAWLGHRRTRHFAPQWAPRPEVVRVGIYDPTDRHGMVIGYPFTRKFVGDLGYTAVRCRDLTAATLGAVDALILPSVQYLGIDDGPRLYETLVDFCVRDGKGIMFFHDACGQAHSLCGYAIFPAICGGAEFYESYADETRDIAATGNGRMALYGTYQQSFRWKKYLAPGPRGTVEAVDAEGRPLIITGRAGRGQAVFCGLLIADYMSGPVIFPEGDGMPEREVLRAALAWL
ncbi:MAG: hypothetical protein ABIF71_02080 [Planctomycetota bacterium]